MWFNLDRLNLSRLSFAVVVVPHQTLRLHYTLHVAFLLFSGYQCGRIPWADVDIMVLVEERGVPKFCLLELCSKVSVDSIELV